MFPNDEFEADLGDGIHVQVRFGAADDGMFQQDITLLLGDREAHLSDVTATKGLDFYLDSLEVDGRQQPMVFIYDLYLGWAIIHAGTLEVHKDFTDIPQGQTLLTKLRLMENPNLILTEGEGFVRKHE